MAYIVCRDSSLCGARGLAENVWAPSYELAVEAARVQLAGVLKEAEGRPDLALGDLTDGLVYPSRALLLCGYLGAYLLSERVLGNADDIRAAVGGKVVARAARRH